MAELGNITYNVTINDEVTKELEKLRDTVSALTDKVAILEKFPVKIEDGTLKVFDENGTVRVQVFNFKEKQ